MIAGWRSFPLGQVAKFINGRAYKQDELLDDGRYRVLRVGNFFTNRNWYYSDLELEPKKYCDSRDLLYAWSASFGPRIWEGGKVIYHYHIWKIEPDPALLDKYFLFYFLEWDKEAIQQQQGAGTTMVHVTKGSIESRLIGLPPLPEQRRIAALLDGTFSGLATAIANTQKNIKNARELFTRYVSAVFVQADHTWAETPLGEVCDMYQPKTISTHDLIENGKYPVYGANGIIGRYDKFNHTNAELLITCRGATCGSVNVSQPKSWITGNAMVVRPKNNDIDTKFLEFAFRGGIDLSPAITGAAQPQITRTSLSPIVLQYPVSVDEQRRLSAAFEKLRAQSIHLENLYANKIKRLENLRQAVLQKAFSGQLTSPPMHIIQQAAE